MYIHSCVILRDNRAEGERKARLRKQEETNNRSSEVPELL